LKGISENCRMPGRLEYMEREIENKSVRDRTVVCGVDSPGNIYGHKPTLVNTITCIWFTHNEVEFCSLGGSFSFSRRILLHGSS
jgi:hypothetical protein